eukprot:2730724-Amphidinium_carterae.1
MGGRGHAITFSASGWEDTCLRLSGTKTHAVFLTKVIRTCGVGKCLCLDTRAEWGNPVVPTGSSWAACV